MFTYTRDEIATDALCVLCNEVLPYSSKLPARRRMYRDTNHPEFKDKHISYVWHKTEALTNCLIRMVKSSKTDNEKSTESSYRQRYSIALAGEGLTVSETVR